MLCYATLRYISREVRTMTNYKHFKKYLRASNPWIKSPKRNQATADFRRAIGCARDMLDPRKIHGLKCYTQLARE